MNKVIVTDCKATVLKADVWRATDDYSLFHITPVRTLGNREVLDDCSFFDVFINHKTEWGAPIPSTFQYFFPDILKIVTPPGAVLVLNVVDLYEGYFCQDRLIEDFLKLNGYMYFFIDKEISGATYSMLFFECPIDRLSVLKEIAFAGTVIDVEGFVLERSKIDLFPSWHRMGNTDLMFRELLKNVFLAFKLWRDHNGMFVASDATDIPTVETELCDSTLEQQIGDYTSSLPLTTIDFGKEPPKDRV